MKIPLVDLKAQYRSIKSEIDQAINECINGGNFIKGNEVSDFEEAFADYIDVKYCLGCGNGTDALEIILASLNIGHGDEVIVPSLTWISTAEAVSNVGAEPIFVEINPINYTIDHTKIEEKITRKTKAIIPVHLYGCPADMEEIIKVSEKHRLLIIEDCAQAHGAQYFGKKVGSFGIASAFSFFPSKNLGAFGDGGAILTNNKDIADSVRKISNHGQLYEKHKHYKIGRNSRLDSIQASILKIKLSYLDGWNLKRQQAASFYISRLKEKMMFTLPLAEIDKRHVYHLFVIRSKNRQMMIKYLDEKNISWGIHYPKPLPLLDVYGKKTLKPSEYANSEAITNEIISIPIYPEITEEQLNYICDQLIICNDYFQS